MSIGAAVYDPRFMQQAAEWVGLTILFTRDLTIRIPALMTLFMAVLALIVSLKMEETRPGDDDTCEPLQQCRQSVKEIVTQTLDTGRWILQTPFAIVIIAAGFLFDGIVRMVITLSSQYYRLIAIPEALFGIIGSGIAMIGLIIPRVAMSMTEKRSPLFNLTTVVVLTFLGLFGMTPFVPIAGLIPVVMLFAAMQMTGFFVSYYLNQITASNQRATVLSFKGLSLNLSYGLVGLLYSALLAFLRTQVTTQHPDADQQALENLLFIASLQWFPWVFLGGLVLFLLFAANKLKSKVRVSDVK
jgi:hypothetical protein